MSEVSAPQGPDAGFAYVGCFTTERRRARGRGIDGYRVMPPSSPDRWIAIEHVDGLENPSYLLADPARQIVYAVHGDGDQASAFAVGRDTGQLRSIGHASTGGTNVVHLALDPTGGCLVVANYGTGSVAVLPVRPDGGLASAIQVLSLPGKVGPNRVEQSCSHPHHVVFDPSGAFVVVPDKGLDMVFVLAFAEPGHLTIVQDLSMRPGAGPRHVVFHPSRPLAFLVNEIESTVATLSWDGAAGKMTPLHLVSTLPSDFFGASTAAAIVVTPCGRFVYASNRGQDGIVRLALDESGDRLSVQGWTPSGGRDPRFMSLDPGGGKLLVTNEQSDSIVGFAIDPCSGDLTPTGTRASPSPCTIAFL